MAESPKENPEETQTQEETKEQESHDVTVVPEEDQQIKEPAENVEDVASQPIQDNASESPGLDESKMELLKDVSFQLTVELGRKEMTFGEVLNLGKGSVIELNKLAEEPVDIYVNQSKIAQGEVVVVDDHFGVRISKIIDPSEK